MNCVFKETALNLEGQIFSWIIPLILWYLTFELYFIALLFIFKKAYRFHFWNERLFSLLPLRQWPSWTWSGLMWWKSSSTRWRLEVRSWFTRLPARLFMFCNSEDSIWINEHLHFVAPAPPLRYRWAGFIQNRWRQLQSTKATEPCYG